MTMIQTMTLLYSSSEWILRQREAYVLISVKGGTEETGSEMKDVWLSRVERIPGDGLDMSVRLQPRALRTEEIEFK
jgi:hypothetical protein